jgi:hypothetical protein
MTRAGLGGDLDREELGYELDLGRTRLRFDLGWAVAARKELGRDLAELGWASPGLYSD